ncbi:MAG: hypothetical protein IJH92_07190, partial [Mogibacterium sp.]|nr:hypothetical protein [Mogibacterium sp.]
NYERTHTVRNTIVIKGSKDLVNKTGSITADEIDISQYYEDAEIHLTFELPAGIYLEKGYEAQVLKLQVKDKATEEEAGDSQTG